MNEFIRSQPVLLIIGITLLTVFGDAYLKKSSELSKPFTSSQFLFGLLVYATTAYLWVYMYREVKFSTIGVVYSILTMLFFVLTGVFVFHETLLTKEVLGLMLALGSVLLLSRFT